MLRPALPVRLQARVYREVSARLGWDRKRDREAARLLAELMADSSRPQLLESLLHGRPCIVLGAGPSLARDVEAILAHDLHLRCRIVAADGAACGLLDAGLTPTVVVSDLDGREDCLLEARARGSLFAVHAHGHNLDAIRRLVPFLEPVLGTCQVGAERPLANLGGLMDGDRAVCLAVAACANPIILGGMDLEGEVGIYSSMGRRSKWEAMYRLRVTKAVLERVARYSRKTLLNATSKGKPIPGFQSITWLGLSRKLFGGG